MNSLLSYRQRNWLTPAHQQLWWRLLIIPAVLLFCAVVPYRTSNPLLFYLVAAIPAGILGLLAFLRWPPLGLIVTLIAGMFIPFSGPSGLNLTMIGITLLLALWLLHMMTSERIVTIVSSRPMLPLVALLVVTLIAFGAGQLPWYTFFDPAPMGAQLGSIAIFALSAGAFILVAHQFRDQRWLEVMTWVFLVVGALYLVGRLVPELRPYITTHFQRGATDSLFWTWLAVLAFSQAAFNRDLPPFWRIVLAGLTIATLYVAYVQSAGWKSGWMPPMAGVAAMLVLRYRRAGFVLAVLGILPAMYIAEEAIATDEYSYSTRMDAWIIMFEIIKVSPILGLGPANYRWYTPLYRIRGYDVQFNSHNQYMDHIAQTGLVGMACLVWFFLEVGLLGLRLRDRMSNGFAEAYVYGALGGLCGMIVAGMLGDWILPFFYNIGMQGFKTSAWGWAFLGGLVALEQMTRVNAAKEGEKPDGGLER